VVLGDGQQVPSSPNGSGSVRALGAFQQSPSGASKEVGCNKFCGFKNRRFLSAGHDRFLVRLGSAGDSNESTENGQGMNAVDILSVIRKEQHVKCGSCYVTVCHYNDILRLRSRSPPLPFPPLLRDGISTNQRSSS